MADKYFAMVWDDPSKSWRYSVFDNDSLEDLEEEINMKKDEGDLNPNARIEYYKADYLRG